MESPDDMESTKFVSLIRIIENLIDEKDEHLVSPSLFESNILWSADIVKSISMQEQFSFNFIFCF